MFGSSSLRDETLLIKRFICFKLAGTETTTLNYLFTYEEKDFEHNSVFVLSNPSDPHGPFIFSETLITKS